MLFRVIVAFVTLLGAALGWVMANGQALTLGYYKDELVKAYDEAGVDTSACKKPRTILDLSGGMTECMQGVYKDISRQIDEVDQAAQEYEEGRERQEEPPTDQPSYDGSAE